MSLTDPYFATSTSTTGSSDAKPTGLCEEEHILLHQVARKAVEQGLRQGGHLVVDTPYYPRPLREPGASFVTLKQHGELRGCIGSLEARRPLVEDVAYNAYAAAFADPRFPPLTEQDFSEVDIQLSVLSRAEPIQFDGEADLLRQLRPGIDGLILEDGRHRGTFLPAVWESLPQPAAFLQHLKMKAGLPADYWSDTLKVSRYTTESF
ncbi:MAG: AmmeMemoRadiSam system protein A [Gammaproteobacteria bacterium]|nr:AmmeMemoRadiSam system protein A [Gammaproteobacteria bacterium]